MTDVIRERGNPRPLRQPERAVLQALLSADFAGAAALREQASEAIVIGMCGCGCPTVEFAESRGAGIRPRVEAAVRGSNDSLFLYTITDQARGEVLAGIEYVGYGDQPPAEFPSVELLDIQQA